MSIRNRLPVITVVLSLWGGLAAIAQPLSPRMAPLLRDDDIKVDRVTLPTKAATGLGFRVDIDVTQCDDAGYVPVEITFAAAGTFPADRRFVLRIEQFAEDSLPPGNLIVVDLPLGVKQGTKTVTISRMFPRYTIGKTYRLTLMEEGRPLEACVVLISFARKTVGQRIQETIDRQVQPRLLLLNPIGSGEDVYAVPGVDAMSLRPNVGTTGTDVVIRRIIRSTPDHSGEENRVRPDWTQLDAGQSPRDWRAYSRFAAVVIRQRDLQALRDQHPGRAEAIKDWVLTGGSLVVLDIDDPASLQPMLGVVGGSEDSGTAVEQSQARMTAKAGLTQALGKLNALRQPTVASWNELARADFPPEADVDATNANASSFMGGGSSGSVMIPNDFATLVVNWESLLRDADGKVLPLPGDVIEAIDRAEDQLKAAADEYLQGDLPWTMRVGAGKVHGVPAYELSTEMFDPYWDYVDRQLWNPFASQIIRRGVDPLLGDSRFYNWMIPGVAQPPVYTFIGLLFLFVVLVGPVAYRWTSKTGRLHLMFAIAPILALLTTTALLTYGVVADGFGTSARIRQITMIDGFSGHAGQRMRSTYFAGIQPSEGLVFPGDAEVVPYLDGSRTSFELRATEASGTADEVVVTESEQRFGAGFLPSRDQRQFVVHRPRSDFGRLAWAEEATRQASSFSETPEGPPGRPLVSTLDNELRSVVIRDSEGTYWEAAKVAGGGATSRVTRLSSTEASKKLGKIYQLQRLFSDVQVARNRLANRRYAPDDTKDLVNLVVRRKTLGTENLSRVQDGIFEGFLQDYLLFKGELPPGFFIALADVDTRELAVPNAEVVESIHFVVGTLP